MGRIKIKDLPKDVEISKEEMKRMMGGGFVASAYGGAPTLYSANFSFGENIAYTCNCRILTMVGLARDAKSSL